MLCFPFGFNSRHIIITFNTYIVCLYVWGIKIWDNHISNFHAGIFDIQNDTKFEMVNGIQNKLLLSSDLMSRTCGFYTFNFPKYCSINYLLEKEYIASDKICAVYNRGAEIPIHMLWGKKFF